MSQTGPAPEPSEPSASGVTEEEIAAAMGVNSVPDEVRLHSSDPDETEQTVDATGQLRPPADQI